MLEAQREKGKLGAKRFRLAPPQSAMEGDKVAFPKDAVHQPPLLTTLYCRVARQGAQTQP